MKAATEARWQQKIGKILATSRGLGLIAGVKGNGKHYFVTSVLNQGGHRQTDRQRIADTFAEFCAQLYACKSTSDSDLPEDMGGQHDVQPVMGKQLRGVFAKMACGKYTNSRGVVVELLKWS